MYNCIIIDDELFARELITVYLKSYPEFNIIGKYKRTYLARPILDSKVKIDVIFLDIQMPKETGVEFLKNNNITPNIIFTTAFAEYAVESYSFNVVDYLLKPIQEERFNAAILKLKKTLEIKQNSDSYLKIISKEDNYIVVKNTSKTIKILHSEILFLNSESEYIKYNLITNQYMVLGSLKALVNNLPSNFIQVHRSYIINLDKIIGRINNNILIEGNEKIPIGKTYRKTVMSMLKSKGF